MVTYFPLNNGKIILFLSDERKCIQKDKRQKTKAQQRSLSEPVFISYIFYQWYSRSQCHCGIISKIPFGHENKTRLLLLANIELILSANMMGNIMGIYHLSLGGCLFYWQDIAWHSIASGFAIIEICLKAFYLALSALIGDRIDQLIWQNSPLQNCIVPKCQVQTWWQSIHLCIELHVRTQPNYEIVVKLVFLTINIQLMLFIHCKCMHSKTPWYKLKSPTRKECRKGEPIWFQLCPHESPD